MAQEPNESSRPNRSSQHITKKSTSSTLQGKKFQREQFDLEQARAATPAAFAVLGLLTSGSDHYCPFCNASPTGGFDLKKHSTKTTIRTDGSWVCYRCGHKGGPKFKPGGKAGDKPETVGNAIDLLVLAGYSFRDAAALLTGGSSKAGQEAPNFTASVTVEKVVSMVDSEIYEYILTNGNVDRAIKFYARFGINPEIVRESGATYLVDPLGVAQGLASKFGKDRVIASGIVSMRGANPGTMLFSQQYPVIEPHLKRDGTCTSMQFRASEEQELRIAEHKHSKSIAKQAGLKQALAQDDISFDPDDAEAYVPKFMSLAGALPVSRVGFGLNTIANLTQSQEVWIVEGFKDQLAARSLGFNAYGLPGAGTLPPEVVAKFLAQFKLVVAFDSDEGGDGGRDSVTKYLQLQRAEVTQFHPPKGMDIADILGIKTSKAKYTSPT